MENILIKATELEDARRKFGGSCWLGWTVDSVEDGVLLGSVMTKRGWSTTGVETDGDGVLRVWVRYDEQSSKL